MRIDNKVSHDILSAKAREVQRLNQAHIEEVSNGSKIPRDKTTISEEARFLQRVRQTIDALPEVRQELIASLRQKIQDGTYQVGSDQMLDRILKSLSEVPDVIEDSTLADSASMAGATPSRGTSKLVQSTLDSVENSSDVRQALVDKVRREIENGTYRINDEALVEALLDPDERGSILED